MDTPLEVFKVQKNAWSAKYSLALQTDMAAVVRLPQMAKATVGQIASTQHLSELMHKLVDDFKGLEPPEHLVGTCKAYKQRLEDWSGIIDELLGLLREGNILEVEIVLGKLPLAIERTIPVKNYLDDALGNPRTGTARNEKVTVDWQLERRG